jgi:molybdate transport system ATP-binding protein
MSLRCHIDVPLASFPLSIRWETEEPSLGIFGHSGAGKTTILESIAGLAKRAEGTIRVNGGTWLDTPSGLRLPPEARGVGYVPQDVLLFPHLDVLGNVRFGQRRAERSGIRGVPLERVLSVLELGELTGRSLSTLSGGERKRVALARALCSGPELLLLDEPLTALDLSLRKRILPYLLRVREEFAIPTIYVSHDASEVSLLCREVLVLSRGRALAIGPPETVFALPEVFAIAREEGFENVLVGRVVETSEGTATIELSASARITVPGEGLSPGQRATIGVRAEDLILALERPTSLSAQNVVAAVAREIRDPEEEGGPVLLVTEIPGVASTIVVSITKQAVRQLSLRPGLPLHETGTGSRHRG